MSKPDIDDLRDIIGCTCSYNEAYDGRSWNLKTEEYEDCECLTKLPALYHRLAAEAEVVTYSKDQININIPAIPISKLKAIMEIKE